MKIKKTFLTLLLIVAINFISCDMTKSIENNNLINRKFLYTYNSGLEITGNFGETNQLQWECIKGPAKGETGKESIHIFEVSKKIYFVNWLEKSNTSVSQILDLNKLTVTAFLTFDAENGRESFVDQGTITEIKK